jgi:hypothetical protein
MLGHDYLFMLHSGRSRGGATLWLGGAWAPPSQRAPPKRKEKNLKKKKKKYNFYPYSLKNL